MLETIKTFFTSIAGVVTGLVDFVIGLITDLVSLASMLFNFVSKIPRLFSWLPSEVVTVIVLIFGVVVFYKIMGREG